MQEDEMIEKLDIGQVVDLAIETERVGHDMYRKLAEDASSAPELQKLFGKLADDERLHEAELRELKNELDERESRQLSDEDSAYLRGLAKDEIFTGEKNAAAAAADIAEREDALQLAYNVEKSTLIYYGALEDVVGQHPVLERIIAMEKQHLRQVMKYLLMPASKMRGVSDQWT
jgi:rubrerythrin